MKILFFLVFFWGLGISGLGFLIQMLLSGDERLLLTEYQNPLIRYSLVVFGANFSIALLSYPVLMNKVMKGKRSEKYEKAVIDRICLFLTAPGFISLFIGGYYAGMSMNRLLLLILLWLLTLISNIVTLSSE